MRSQAGSFGLSGEIPNRAEKNATILIARSISSFQLSADCSDPNCSGHGACVSGKCYCKAGWQGERCNQVDQQVYQCLPGCSDHGTYDLESAACVCEEHWTGVDCSQPSCGLDCGPHGSCERGRCKSVYIRRSLWVLCGRCDRDSGIGLAVRRANSRSPGLNEESDACLNAPVVFLGLKEFHATSIRSLSYAMPAPRVGSLFNVGDLRNCSNVATIYARFRTL